MTTIRERVKPASAQIVPARAADDPLPATMALLASALFCEPRSAKFVARYLVAHYATPDKDGLRHMDELADAILRAPFSLRIYGMRGLATAASSASQFVLVLELWHGVPVALPLEYAFHNELLGLARAVGDMFGPRSRDYYRHVRRNDVDGEYTFENLAPRAAHELATRAWPVLLLTLCYYYFCDMFDAAVRDARVERSFALDAVRASYRQLDLVLLQPDGLLTLRRAGALACPDITAPVLHKQLQQLRDILGGVELGGITKRLLSYASELAAACSPEPGA